MSKGLTFIPTAQDLTNFEILSDFNTFANKLRKRINPPRIYQCTDGFPIYRHNKNTNKRNLLTKYPQFEGTLQAIKIQLSELQTDQSNMRNLSRAQSKALQNLCKNNNIVINKADKGSTIVIINKKDYIEEGLKNLNVMRTYKLLSGNPTKHICKQISSTLTDAYKKFYLTKNMYDFCLPPKNTRLARIYFLKKIYKNPMGIRSIVSSCQSPTENISQFIDFWLQPHVKTLQSFLRDSSQFITEIEQLNIPVNSLLVTIDITSLHTNIPHKDGIKACHEAFLTRENVNLQQPPAEILTDLLEIVLTNYHRKTRRCVHFV